MNLPTPFKVLIAGAAVTFPFITAASAPCIRPTRAGTQVQGEVQVCPGRYRVPDPRGQGVLVAASSGTRIDLTGVTLQSGDTAPERYVGRGVLANNVDNVTIIGGTIRGYQYGVRIEGGRGHRISGVDVSGSRAQRLRSTPARYDERDWLDIFRPDTFELYGSGIYLRGTDGASVTNVVSRGAQNGIGLFAARSSYIADNDVSGNSGWGIHLWRSAQNIIVRNRAHHNVRCESEQYRRGCDSAALLSTKKPPTVMRMPTPCTTKPVFASAQWTATKMYCTGRTKKLPSPQRMLSRNAATSMRITPTRKTRRPIPSSRKARVIMGESKFALCKSRRGASRAEV